MASAKSLLSLGIFSPPQTSHESVQVSVTFAYSYTAQVCVVLPFL